jgi:hypothetical protein
MSPPQTGSITIVAQGERAARLLSCLREDLRESHVDIAHPDGNLVIVTDHSGSASSLSDFLEERLERCSQVLGIADWTRHLRVDRQSP